MHTDILKLKNKVKRIFKKEIITPGIRFKSKKNDQKRIMSPKEAYKQGSDWLVIGRELTNGDLKDNLRKLSDHLYKWHLNVKFVVYQNLRR